MGVITEVFNARLGCQVHYSVGFDFDERVGDVLPRLPESAWTPPLDADGAPRPDAQVAELTGLLRHRACGDRLTGWPPDMRILIRRENPHPDAQRTLFEQHEGKRYQVTSTSTPGRAGPAPSKPATAPGQESKTGPVAPRAQA